MTQVEATGLSIPGVTGFRSTCSNCGHERQQVVPRRRPHWTFPDSQLLSAACKAWAELGLGSVASACCFLGHCKVRQ